MTVVLESEGTTTVVVFVGSGGLLLLMQPDSSGIRKNKLARTFITASLSKTPYRVNTHTLNSTRRTLLGSSAARELKARRAGHLHFCILRREAADRAET